MLDALIPGLLDGVVDRADHRLAQEFLAAEHARLADPAHLTRHVIGSPGEFAWDFDALGEGFLELARPFLALPTGIGGLYVTLLRELGAWREEHLHGVLILEYMHLATRINDHFNFHDELAKHAPDQHVAERLVQLRYTAQFLNNYPRYTIVEDRYGASAGVRIALHRWGIQLFTTIGLSRASFLRWMHGRMRGVDAAAYRQNSIFALGEHLMSPVQVALILAETDETTACQVRKAFALLQLAVKIRCERRVARGDSLADLDGCAGGPLLAVTFPGLVLLASGATLPDLPLDPDLRFPRVRAVHAAGVAQARRAHSRVAGELVEEERRCLAGFAAGLGQAGVLTGFAERVTRAFAVEELP